MIEKMSTNKRGFLKALSMAPVAAVSAQRSIVESIAKHAATSNALMGVSAFTGSIPFLGAHQNESYWLNELKYATERLAELNKVQSVEKLPAAMTASIKADALRSVSPAVRILIAEREATAIELARKKTWAQKTIDHAKSKLGLLGAILG